MCFKSVVDGFKAGCRRVIGLNGYFLKTITKGLLLSTVGKDGKDQMYPIAWVVVEGHIYTNWKKKGHSTTILKNMFWKAVKCTTPQEFERIMRQMEAMKPQAAHDF